MSPRILQTHHNPSLATPLPQKPTAGNSNRSWRIQINLSQTPVKNLYRSRSGPWLIPPTPAAAASAHRPRPVLQ
jgi:hypothetical protein